MKMEVHFAENSQSFNAVFGESNSMFAADMGEVQIMHAPAGYEVYEGSYTVTPKVTSQELETADRLLKENVTVNAIPYWDVSNETGGSTVYIGSEV